MVQIYYSCTRPELRKFSRYIRFAKRKLGMPTPLTMNTSVEEARRRLWHREFPASVDILLGNQCNLSCEFCPYHGPTAPIYFSQKQEMPETVLHRLETELPKYSTSAKFGGFEESLLYPSFARLARRFIDGNVPVHLTTNGTLITPELMPLLQELNTLYVSIDAATEKTYRKLRGGNFHQLVTDVSKLAEGFHGLKLGVSFIRNPANLAEESIFIDYWLQRVDLVILYALATFDKDHYEIDHPFIDIPDTRVVCSSPWRDTYVLPNGDVSLCCQTLAMTGRHDIPIMGNLLDQSLHEIWNGDRYAKYRDALLNEDWDAVPFCKQCPLWSSSYCKTTRIKGFSVTYNPTTKIIGKP
jgi:MoaA/NifB/PqqE/SkfB family radical SAM enzyme